MSNEDDDEEGASKTCMEEENNDMEEEEILPDSTSDRNNDIDVGVFNRIMVIRKKYLSIWGSLKSIYQIMVKEF